ncbi:MAG: archaeosine biosynthesis radical SAM protein RaSEA [Candidatus Thermoplasmatota archaeon]|nr:archaeosine biosynthesis radical SAM protein RaSEA [Candidatus Thermoplasmatota archaeon]
MNKELANFIRELKKDFKPKKTDITTPVSCWFEKDLLNDKVVDAFVIIFKTRGCSWALESGCSMCGYFNDSLWSDVSDKELLQQFESALKRYKGEKFVKIFTSGSFLDDNEINPIVREKILKKLYETAEKVSVESRPEYITNKSLEKIKKIVGLKIFEIGIGLETADDDIRENNINKGFTFNDYKKATDIMKKNNIKIKTYVLVKPPFLSEKHAINDAIRTIEKIKNITDIVSLNPVNAQNNTLVNYLWKREQYRSPWLFSIVQILVEGKKILDDKRIKCDIVGGGSIRGAHNCGECDKNYLQAISDFSLKQDTRVFNNLKCSCSEKWLDQLDLEDLGFGSLAKMYE